MNNARPPTQLTLEGGPVSQAENWRQWYSQFTMFLKSSGLNRGGSDVKASILLDLIGPKGYDIYSSFMLEKDEDTKDFDMLVKKFDEYFETKQDCTVTRYNFFTRSQKKNESIDDYVTALRLLAHECQFAHLEEELIKDRLVCGVREDSIRESLLSTTGLTVENAMKICQADGNLGKEKKQIEEESRRIDVSAEMAEVMYTYNSHRRRNKTARKLQHSISA